MSNCRKIFLALCALALCKAAQALAWMPWFDAGIGENWPTNAAMSGGTWCQDATKLAEMAAGNAYLKVSSDDDDPLVFASTYPKPLGDGNAATNVVVAFSCAFQPFSANALPAVPDDAKGAVILVTDDDDPEEAADGEIHYAAYDPDAGANVWHASGLRAKTDDMLDVSMAISRGDPGFVDVAYSMGGVLFASRLRLSPSPSLRQPDAVVRDVVYSGAGRTQRLLAEYRNVQAYRIGESEYADFATMNAALKDGDTVFVQLDDTLPAGATLSKRVAFRVGRSVLATLPDACLTNAADVTFHANSPEGLSRLAFFILADRTLTLPEGTSFEAYLLSGEDFAHAVVGDDARVRVNGVWQTPEPVTMNFYYPGYGMKEKVTIRGPLGTLIESDELESYLNDVYFDDSSQKYYWDGEAKTLVDGVYWFDETWKNGTNGIAFLPTHFTRGDFYPGSTAIVFRIAYDMGGVSGASNPNPTGYTIVTPIGLGDASASGWNFEGWTDEGGRAVTTVDPVAIGVANDGWLTNITLYANWSEQKTSAPKKLKATTVAPGESAAYYDTAEQAQTAAAAFNADEEGGFLPPAKYTGDRTAYSANFKAVADGSTVSVGLTDAARERLAEKVGGATLSAAAGLTDPCVSTVTVEGAEPGFYYSVVGMTAADGVAKEGARKLAQEPTVELEKPVLEDAGRAFYRIKASVK